MGILLALALLFSFGLLAYGNPMPVGTPQFWLLAERRTEALFAMVVVALCHSLATGMGLP